MEGEAIDKMALERPRKVESAADMKVWAIDSADEIKSELKQRAHMRAQTRQALVNRIENLSSGASEEVSAEEVHSKRSGYWTYLRQATQFIQLQNLVLERAIEQEEAKVAAKALKYAEEKEKTNDMYKYIALLEKPLE